MTNIIMYMNVISVNNTVILNNILNLIFKTNVMQNLNGIKITFPFLAALSVNQILFILENNFNVYKHAHQIV